MASLEKLLVISSDDKDNPSDSNSDFSVTLKESYYTQNVLRVLVKEVTIPNVFPNIRGSAYGSNQNNTLVIRDNIDRTITLPEGQYLINSSNPSLDFTTILQNAINAVSTSTWVVSYNELTNKIEFEVTAGVPVLVYSNAPPFGNANSNMAETLGITSNIQILVGNTESSQEQLDLSGIQNVYVHSKEIADTHGIDGDSGLIALVDPVNLSNAPYGSYAYKQENDDELASIVYEDVRNLSRLRIILRDNLGNKLPIGTHKMNIVLKIYLASG